MFSVWCATVLGGIVAVFHLCIKRQYSFWANKNVPSQKPVFPVGNVKIIGPRDHMCLQMAKLYSDYRTHGLPFVGLYFFVWPVVLATSLDFIRNVFITDFQHFQERGRYYNERDDKISANLFNLVHEKWKILRSKLTSVFTSGKLKSMYPSIVNIVNESVTEMGNLLQTRDEIDVSDFVSRIQMDIIGACTFGVEFNCLKNPNSEFLYYSDKVVNPKFTEEMSSVMAMKFKRLAKLFRVRSIRKDVSDFFTDLIKDAVSFREKNNVQRDDLLGQMIKLKNAGFKNEMDAKTSHMTLDEMAAQSFAFFMGGTKTASTTMAFALCELAQPKNRHMQEKARREINAILQKYNDELTFEALHEMPYIEAIVNGKPHNLLF